MATKQNKAQPRDRGSTASRGYARWLKELKTLAKRTGMWWVVHNSDAEWLHRAYDDDMTPKEVLQEEYDEALRSA